MGSTASVLAKYIAAAGVERVFAYPGDPVIEFFEESRLEGIDVVLARREATAAFMAEATAMTTGSAFGVCVSTLGPGSTAMVNGVAAANLDRVPLIAVSGQIDSARETFFTHQVVNHQALFEPITKGAGRLSPGSAATSIRKAIRLATAERPGAVHLSVGEDVFRAEASDDEIAVPPMNVGKGGYTVSSVSGEDPHRLLAAAQRPVLLAGIGAVRSGAFESLSRLADKAGIPVVVGPMAKGVVDERSPMFAGTLDMACNIVLWDFLATSDLIIAAGFDPVELIKPWSVRVPVLHLDTTPNTDQVYASRCEVVGDIDAMLEDLAASWIGEPRWTEAEVADHRSILSNAYFSGRVSGRLNPTDVIDTVAQWADVSAVVTTDVGSHKLLVGQGWQATQPRSTLMSNGLSVMGFGVPAAIAAQMAHPGREVVSLVGDGGFAMVATEMRLASSLGLPITVVVFVDGSLNRIELKQMAKGYPSVATRIEDMDLVGLAEAMGCQGERAETPAELDRALRNKRDDPLIIEARIDPSQYESQF